MSDAEKSEVPDAGDPAPKEPLRSKLREVFSDPVRKRRIAYLATAAVSVLAVSLAGYFAVRQYSQYAAVPQVLGANFSLEYRKIPFDVPSVDFTLSVPLDPATVNASTVTVSPSVPGSVSVKNSNIVSFALSEKLEIGSRYVFTLSKDIASKSGKALGRDYVVELEAVSGVMVARAIPTGETPNLAKDPVFIFNVPVVPLGTLASEDELPCPVKFEPSVPGRCNWIAGNVLEYDLEKPLRGSTKYAVSVSNSPAFLYPLKNEFRSEFSTPVLSAFADTGSVVPFSPAIGIPLRFSTEVTAESLAEKLSVVNESNGQAVPAKAVAADSAPFSDSFSITGKDGPFDHSATYRVTVGAGLMPANGNLAMSVPVEFRARANDFITEAIVKFPHYSETWALLDTLTIWDPLPIIPANNAILTLQFDEKVDFATAKPRVETLDGTLRRECKTTPFEADAWINGEKTKRQALKCELPSDRLPYGASVRLVLPKEASASLKSDATRNFTVSPKFEVSDFKLLSVTEACFASTTPVLNNPEYFVTVPAAPVREISEDSQYSVNEKGESVRTFRCPQVPGKKTYVASVRLNPKTEYSFRLRKGLPDGYGNRLESDADFGKVITGEVSEKDRYLYSSATNVANVIPADAKIVLGVQSVNADSFMAEACETDATEYFLFSARRYDPWYLPKCRVSKKVSVPLQNRHWKLSPKQLDVETEILGKTISSPFVVVRGSLKDSFNVGENGYRDDDREFLNFYVRSSIALAYERAGQGKSLVFATSIDGKALLSDLVFQAFDYDGDARKLVPANAKFVWNPKKSAYEVTGSFRYLVAKNATGFGVVTTDGDQANNYDFGLVSGQDTATKDYAYAYSDRPIYRAGDTVHFKAILRRFQPDGYRVSPVKSLKIRIVDQDGNVFKEITAAPDKNSHVSGSFDLVKDMRTGRYDFVLIDSEESLSIYNDGHFFVEQYVKPTFRVSASEADRDVLPKQSVSADLEATYYFGWAVPLAPYSTQIMSQNYFFDPKEYSDYRFGTADSNYDCVYWGYCDTSDSFVATLTGKLDGNGRTRISYVMPELAKTDQERIYSFNTDVTDPDTGKTVNATVSKILHHTDANVGIRSPYWVNKSDPIRVEGVVLDHTAKALPGKTAKIEFVRREWKEVKKLGIDGTYYSENEIVETSENSQSVTTDSEGRLRAEYKPSKGGEFEIRASYAGKNGQESVASSYAYVATEDYVSWGGTNNSVTRLTAEKTMVKPGAKAVFTLKSPVANGKAFVVVEKDDAILDAFSVDIRSFAERIEVPIDTRHIPNVYVKAYLIGKPDGSPLPVYKRALSAVKVVPDEKKLMVTLVTDHARKNPGEPLTVSVSVKDAWGNPVKNANGSLSVVDESVLALMGNPKKNPFAFFYEMKRYLGVDTFLSLTNLVEKLEVKTAANADGAKGGAWEDRKGGDAKKKRGVFKDTAYWTADFTTDSNGKFSTKIDKLPDNLTTWVVEAVVSVPSDNRIGVGLTSVTTSKEVMVSDNLPRIFRSGDSVVLSPVVYNRTGKDAEFAVSVSADGLELDKTSARLLIKNGQSAPASFIAKPKSVPAGKEIAMAKIAFMAVASDGKSDVVEKNVPIRRSETWESVATVGSTSDVSFDERLNLSGVDPARSELSLRYGASLFSNAFDGLEFLLRFPYGCVEQRTSAILPHVVTKRLADAIGEPFDIDKAKVEYYDADGRRDRTVREALEDYAASMRSYRVDGGGFGYWASSGRADFAMTSYALAGLASVRGIGIPVDAPLLSDASAYLKREFAANRRPYCQIPQEPSPQFASVPASEACSYPVRDRLAAIRAVSLTKPDDYEAYKMWKLLDSGKFTPGQKVRALSVIAELSKNPKLAPEDRASLDKSASGFVDSLLNASLVLDSRWSFLSISDEDGGRVSATAEFLDSAVRLGYDKGANAQIFDGMSRFLSHMKKKDGSYGSTTDTVAVVSAFAWRAVSDASAMTNFVAKWSLNGAPLFETGMGKSQVTRSFEKRIPLAGVPEKSTLNFSKTGNGKLYYDLSLTYPVEAEKISARDEGIFVKTETYDLSEFRRVKALKDAEWRAYLSGSVRLSDLKYPKDAYSYVAPITKYRVGQLVLVRYRAIVAEDRDRVAFESFVPAGSEIVNTRLSTESKTVTEDTFFDREEFLDDRYFGFVETLPAGDYEGSYVLRATHAGSYSVPPTRIFEFYAPEVFGRTEGKKFEISQK